MLLELIISIAILTVMLAVALPNVALAQQAAQKQNAVQMLRTQALQATQQCLSTGYTIHSQGYTFSFLPLGCDANNTYTLTWAMTADPITGSANQTHYYVDQGPPTLTIRYSNGSPATAASNPI